MMQLYTLATAPSVLSTLAGTDSSLEYTTRYQARHGMRMPVLGTHVGTTSYILAEWGIHPEVHTVQMEHVMRRKPFNRWIHTQRCAIPANCFIVQKTGEANPYLVRLPSARVFFMGGLLSRNGDAASFLILTTQSADILASVTDSMPVLFTADSLQTWLIADHLMDVMHIADRAGDHWVDYFRVSPDILNPEMDDRELLKPIGTSLREAEERDLKLKSVDLKQDRFDRRGGKW